MRLLHRFEFTVLLAQYDDVVAFLTMNASQGWEEDLRETEGVAHFKVHLEDHPMVDQFEKDLRAGFPDIPITRSEIEEEDWTMAWREFFTPVNAGGVFEILPPWLEHEKDDSKKTIIIEPKMAFGTGHHATTALCLEVIGQLLKKGRISHEGNFLDLGTGSGILGIALAMHGQTGIGLDIDPQAVTCAVENTGNNGVGARFSIGTGSIDALKPETKFDLIVANILSGPLISMSPAIASHLKEDGILILSGVLVEQAPAVIAAYRAQGLPEPETLERGEWAAIWWA